MFYSPTEETATFYAQYTLDPVNESMEEEDFNSLTWCGVSQPVTVHAVSLGSLMLPEITADPGLRVHRGDTVTLSYTPFGYEGEGGSLYIYGVDPDTGEDTLAGRYYHNGECQFTVDTSEMVPGEYILSINQHTLRDIHITQFPCCGKDP